MLMQAPFHQCLDKGTFALMTEMVVLSEFALSSLMKCTRRRKDRTHDSLQHTDTSAAL